MVVELLDIHNQWLAIEENRPPVHLILLKSQKLISTHSYSRAFIRKIMDLLAMESQELMHYTTQVVVTSHSTHILYERGFRPIRYFRRKRSSNMSATDVLNLSVFMIILILKFETFFERYLKLTHCDLFFADGAVLVEGNVERLLLPQMIATAAPRLKSST